MTDPEIVKLLRDKIREQARIIRDQAKRIEELKAIAVVFVARTEELEADITERRRRIDQLESTIIATQA